MTKKYVVCLCKNMTMHVYEIYKVTEDRYLFKKDEPLVSGNDRYLLKESLKGNHHTSWKWKLATEKELTVYLLSYKITRIGG